jgi:hypothetical protein
MFIYTPGVVYLIEDMQQPGLYKVGYGRHLRTRLLAIACLRPVRLVWYIVTNEARVLEAHIHRMFAGNRAKGEWFRLTETQVATFKTVRTVNWKEFAPISPACWPDQVKHRSHYGRPRRRLVRIGEPIDSPRLEE